MVAQPLSQLDDWLYPTSNQGKPVKNQLRNHSPRTQREEKASTLDTRFWGVLLHMANGIEFKKDKNRQKKKVAISENGTGTKPYLFMLTKTQLVPVRKAPKLKVITSEIIFSDL
tara:strand:- start:2896 stop:3237 length:342 start_codon:yes stop_codon:yes gene_type:complete